MMVTKARNFSSPRLSPSSSPTSSRWAVELTGRNSVMAWTIPRRMAARDPMPTPRNPLEGLAAPSLAADGGLERVLLVGALPGEGLLLAAEVAVGGGRLVDGAEQVEAPDDLAGGEAEDLADRRGDR